ncbi:uncharacterized protein LOC119992919 [Tripterygium wilfordii]|uniref:uncharacterized protein LOC119992919 n=1 Tax=Tripterygium wilfordii TaxID=458696 RepID=UPI0018F86018|nr:uncharacterized protein LOC119992919 [Tripterygium wilfordii]
MSGDNLTDEVSKERAVLGDVTNTLAVHLESRKRMLLLLQRIMHQKLRRGFSDQKLFGSYDASRDSCISRGTLPTCSEGNSQDGDDKEVIGSNPGLKGLVSQVFDSENKDIGFGRFAANKYGSVEWSRLQNAQDSKSFELEKCTGLRGNACVNLEAADDLLKACSFCLKAAYIWSDLRYQDIKGRISVVKRRKKETSILVSKMGRGKQSDIHHGQGSSKSSTNLVSDLTNQRRSLFLYLKPKYCGENSRNLFCVLLTTCGQSKMFERHQRFRFHELFYLVYNLKCDEYFLSFLQHANFNMLKDKRENCKMDLETATSIPPERL